MKKILLIVSGLLLPAICFAETPEGCSWDPTIYALKMSPNGKWIGSRAGDAALYNVQTGVKKEFPECYFGLGNCVANNGMAVGNSNDDAGAIFFNDEAIYPEEILAHPFCDINAITPDATRICGVMSGERGSDILYVPFVANVNPETAEVSELTTLPYPKLDFFGAAPQFVAAVWISANGKCILGYVEDWRGGYSYPIVFNESESGEWNYYLPSEPLFNPTHIELPPNPWLNEPPFPEPENFMSGLKLAAYQEAYAAYISGIGPEPEIKEYMTDQEYEQYAKAVEDYNEWYYGSEQKQKEYRVIYNQILRTSPNFTENDLALDPNGKFFMIHGGVADEDLEMVGKIYKFSTTTTDYTVLNPPLENLNPRLILSDGTLFASTPMMDVPTSYMVLPETTEFIYVFDYFQTNHPSIASWLQEEFPNGSGEVCCNDDMTLFAGALLPGQLKDYDYDSSPFFYSSWIVNLDPSGVESIVADPEDGIYRVYNLQGVKVMETGDASLLNNLGKGLYIINGKKVIL